MLSAVECGRGSGRKELGDERVGRQRETVRSGKFVEGVKKKASETQQPQFKIHSFKGSAIFRGPLPCSASPGTVGPQMEPLLGATGQPALGHVSQAASGWCVQWKASVGPKGEGVGEAREARPPPPPLPQEAALAAAADKPSESQLPQLTLDFHNFISSLCLPPQGQWQLPPHLNSSFICGNNSPHGALSIINT